VKETALDKRSKFSVRQKGQYALAFFVVGAMLFFIGFPAFLLFFFGILTFFIWKAFSNEPRGEVRRIFEFYLMASEVLRHDERRWFGFELRRTIAVGEAILGRNQVVPPLVYFALGALHQKAGDHASAVKYLGDSPRNEESIVIPTTELEEYARLLRTIERSPTEAPLTAAAVRSLERMRKTRSDDLLRVSQEAISTESGSKPEALPETAHAANDLLSEKRAYSFAEFAQNRRPKTESEVSPERRTISEVLHDIYDDQAEG